MGQAVVISRGLPRWRFEEAQAWPRCWALTPSAAALDATADVAASQYLAQLEAIGAARIARSLTRIAYETQADRLVCLCFEQSPDHCHRGLWAAFWLSTGEVVTELPEPLSP